MGAVSIAYTSEVHRNRESWLLASKCMRWHSRFTISVNFGGVSDGDSVHVPRVEPILNSWSPFFHEKTDSTTKYLGPKKCESYNWLLASKCMRWHSRFTISVNFGGVSDGGSVHVTRVQQTQ